MLFQNPLFRAVLWMLIISVCQTPFGVQKWVKCFAIICKNLFHKVLCAVKCGRNKFQFSKWCPVAFTTRQCFLLSLPSCCYLTTRLPDFAANKAWTACSLYNSSSSVCRPSCALIEAGVLLWGEQKTQAKKTHPKQMNKTQLCNWRLFYYKHTRKLK